MEPFSFLFWNKTHSIYFVENFTAYLWKKEFYFYPSSDMIYYLIIMKECQDFPPTYLQSNCKIFLFTYKVIPIQSSYCNSIVFHILELSSGDFLFSTTVIIVFFIGVTLSNNNDILQ
jgi:hypothetical protein